MIIHHQSQIKENLKQYYLVMFGGKSVLFTNSLKEIKINIANSIQNIETKSDFDQFCFN